MRKIPIPRLFLLPLQLLRFLPFFLRICENPASISPQFTSTPSLKGAVSEHDDLTPFPRSSSTPASISPQFTSTPSREGAVGGGGSAVSGRGSAVSERVSAV
jgi:hypothetical protein